MYTTTVYNESDLPEEVMKHLGGFVEMHGIIDSAAQWCVGDFETEASWDKTCGVKAKIVDDWFQAQGHKPGEYLMIYVGN